MTSLHRNTILALLIALAGVFATAASVRAEEPASEGPTLERLAKELNLTDAQKAAIAPIVRQEAEEFRALQADTSLRRMQRLRRAKQINDKASTAIRAQLTPEQLPKYEELRAALRSEMKQRLKDRKAAQSAAP